MVWFSELLAHQLLLLLVVVVSRPASSSSSLSDSYVPLHGLSDHEHVFQEPDRLLVSSSLRSCCDWVLSQQPEQLIQCVNSSASSLKQQVQAQVPYWQTPSKQGPTLQVAVVTRATSSVYEYAAFAYFLQAVYAQHNGYYSLPLLPDTSRPDYQRYRKLVPLLDAMTTHAVEADFIVWLDAGE